MKVCIVIPAYNESRNIQRIINEINKLKLDLKIIVVDDGSTDETLNLAKDFCAICIANKKNLGKGSSLIKGFDYALNEGFDLIITMDGDMQHLPSDIPNFLDFYQQSKCDILVGNRMLNTKNMPILRLLTNWIMSIFISSLCKQNIPDTQCGFRLINKEALKKIDFETKRYEIESELLIKAAKKGFRIKSIPINTVYLGQKSQINPFIDTFRFINFVFKQIFMKKDYN